MPDSYASLLPLRLNAVSYAAGGKLLLDRVEATLNAGVRTIILGANGAGKSLLMRICHGLVQPTGGSVDWLSAFPVAGKKRHAMVFQRPVMLRRSAVANIRYALAMVGVSGRRREALAKEALARVGLSAIEDRPARVLSGGEQQRVALARAWALEPEVLFLDEPTASLDPGATREVEAIINAMHLAGTKIVMTTHNLGQARRLGDEILFLHQGRLVEQAPADRFFSFPATVEAGAFIKGELPWN